MACEATACGVVCGLFHQAEKKALDADVGMGGQGGGHVQVFDSTHDCIKGMVAIGCKRSDGRVLSTV